MKTCDVTGTRARDNQFYPKQSHLKFVDNLRRKMGWNKEEIKFYLQ